jgi:phage-related protein
MSEELGSLAVNIGLDSSGFQNGISAINRQLRVLDSEFKSNTAALGENGKGIDGLKLKNDTLLKQIELQKQKVEALQSAFLKSAKTKGVDAKATQDLEIKLNNAKASLSNMENELVKTNKQLEESSSKQGVFSKAAEKLHLTLGELKVAFGTVGIAAGSYLKGAVEAAAKGETSTKRLTQLLENQGMTSEQASDKIKEFTGNMIKMSTFSGGEAKAALQTLTEKGISVANALKMESTIADVAAGRNISLKEASDLVADAYHGKAKALTSLGILTKEEAKNLGNAEKATISMDEVQKRLNERFGGSSQAQLNTFNGKMQQYQNQMNAIKVQIGSALLPTLMILANELYKILQPIADFAQAHPKIMAATLAIVAVLGTLVGGLSVLNNVIDLLGPVGTMIGGLGTTIGGLSLPIIAVVAAIALAVYAGYELYNNWGNIKKYAVELGNSIKTCFETIKSDVTNAWNNVKNETLKAWEDLKNAVNNGLSSIKNFLEPTLNFYETIFKNVWDIIKNIVLGAVLIILDLITGNFTNLETDIENIWNNIKNDLFNIWEVIKNTAISAWNELKNSVVSLCSNIKETAINIWSSLIDWFTTLPERLYDNGREMFTSMKKGVTSTIDGVTSAIENGIKDAINYLASLPSKAWEYGVDFVEGMVNGIKSAIGQVGDAVDSIANKIRSYLHFSVPDEGPLADYEKWMPDFMSGLAEGINKSKNLVSKAIQGLSVDMKLNTKVAVAGKTDTQSSNEKISSNSSLTLRIENFYNNTQKDIEQLAYELEFYRQKVSMGRGV